MDKLKVIITDLRHTAFFYEICSIQNLKAITRDELSFVSYFLDNTNNYSLYKKIIDALVKHKQDKLKFIIDTHNKFIKYIDFALEECDTSIKLLSSIDKTNLWTQQFDDMVNKIIYTEIQRHKYFVSLQIPSISITVTYRFEDVTGRCSKYY
jgi:hypothetical protein